MKRQKIPEQSKVTEKQIIGMLKRPPARPRRWPAVPTGGAGIRARSEFRTVSVIGLGYIGLPTAATLASRGLDVIGVDISNRAVDAINGGHTYFSEPDLDGLVQAAVMSGRLRAYTEPRPADAFIIAVPTPVQRDKAPDMRFVECAARSVARVLKEGNLVILESTSPVGTTRSLAGIIAEERPDLIDPANVECGLKISLAYCPERILPGRMVYELTENDRVVGGVDRESAARAKALYSTFVRGAIYETSSSAAELVKLIENAYRDVNIAFANEVANICDRMDLDPWETIKLANRHPRVNILNPGPGVGGHCIAVDPWFLIAQHPDLTPLLRAARNVNDGRPSGVVRRVMEAAAIAGSRRVCCLGLAYKSDVDDLRESPAMEVATELAEKGYDVVAVEPNICALPEHLAHAGHVSLAATEDAVRQSDVVVLLVGHKAFRDIDRQMLAGKKVVDCVGLWPWAKTADEAQAIARALIARTALEAAYYVQPAAAVQGPTKL
ncbi:UDP-N-acetyl-D-mannosamine dehydrogenase [Mesorhizobium sp. SP-1A]|uniref:UDP-N-acetyl-D-mannosamine dehydrogenase n=1 Tax=Mesorhizobium sp. SP-1A TaxID=3077840 RepID=UPI0028F72B04|nr:UDP-N-acetyl-D-mannosamine dehydrogenase [Mesorhizobium sp. SP-1A]